MRIAWKKTMRWLAKRTPGFRLRVALLRWAGHPVGRDVFVGEDLIIVDEPSDWGLVSIGDRVAIAPRVTLIVSSRPNAARIAPFVPTAHNRIVIGDDAWIGTGAVIMPGVTIGEGAVVGANSLVRADVPPYTIVAGSPARSLREVPVPWFHRAPPADAG